jgi:hypothetical protein
MIEPFTFTYTDLIDAKIKAKPIENLKNSITKGAGSVGAVVSEMKLAEYLGGEWTPTYQYDVTYNGYRIENKTKRTTMDNVLSNYEASVATLNTTQKCDIYVFTRINEKLMKGWFCGWVTPKEYYKNAIFHEKGEKDHSNDFTFKQDCYNMKYSKMHSVNTIKNLLPNYRNL